MAKLARSPRRGGRELKLYALHVKKPSHRAPGGRGCVLSMLIHLQHRPVPPQHGLHAAADEWFQIRQIKRSELLCVSVKNIGNCVVMSWRLNKEIVVKLHFSKFFFVCFASNLI